MRNNGVYAAWAVSLTALLGSLYFSEVKGFVPCALCWLQRGFMYPIPLLLAYGLIRNKTWTLWNVWSLCLGGFLLAAYHYALQRGMVSDRGVCSEGISCTVTYIQWFGFVTIPFLAMVGFVLIGLFTTIAYKKR